jgi:hypothetical protein
MCTHSFQSPEERLDGLVVAVAGETVGSDERLDVVPIGEVLSVQGV